MKNICLIVCLAFTTSLWSQDIAYARYIVDTLSHPDMHGRGYVEEGHKKAARFIASEWAAIGLQPLGDDFFQSFDIDVNTFPGALEVSIDNQVMQTGADYILDPCAPSFIGFGPLIKVDSQTLFDKSAFAKLITKRKSKDAWLVIDETALTINKGNRENYQWAQAVIKYSREPVTNGLIVLQENLTWHMAGEVCEAPVIYMQKDSFPANAEHLTLQVDHAFQSNLTTQNVVGMIKGTDQPDSFIVFTGHYDHLGRMGADTYIPGANDNASGIAMLSSLAKYYAQHPPAYSVVFIAFGGEEVFLSGSKYFVEHPLIPLENIRFLVNMDILGTGSEGLAVVNGRVFEKEMQMLQSINAEKALLKKFKRRGKAAISDHHFFTEAGVRCFFIYTMGGIAAYHDIYDRPETLPLTAFEEIHLLLTTFASRLMNTTP